KLSAYTPLVTRAAMLAVSAFALLGVFRLARQVSNLQVAAASTLLTALYPVFFAQSSLAHLDMMAAGFTLWGLSSYLRHHWWQAAVWFALAGISKETALVTPMALFGWEAVRRIWNLQSLITKGAEDTEDTGWKPLLLLASLLPLLGWLTFHWTRTGIFFGNPEYFRYNVGATVHPLRIVLALLERLWQLLGYLNMFVLTCAAALAMGYAPIRQDGQERPRIAIPVQAVFAVVIAAYLAMLAVVGGAVLARYLLPVYPLAVIVCVSTLWRRITWWPFAVGVAAIAFVAGLFVVPPYQISPEDNLSYVDFVRLHQQAAEKIAAFSEARVLTAWPASDELTRPYLGYVPHSVPVVQIENFTLGELSRARKQDGEYNCALVFSSKFQPSHPFHPAWWERRQTRFFDYHRDLPPEAAAQVLGGNILYEAHRGGEWVAIIAAGSAMETENAKLK
ncbi:MAG TPA: glycosyltransferase, partial [Armatimonadota bacterium]|nr:glycosyltransferase [Armatimonadota bacterium]